MPLFVLIAHFKVIAKGGTEFGGIVPGIGIFTTLIVVVMLLIQWVETTHRMDEQYTKMDTSDELPTWVKLAQKIDRSWVIERILKSDLIYQVPNERVDWLPLGNFE